MQLSYSGLQDRAAWEAAGVKLPKHDWKAMVAETEANPTTIGTLIDLAKRSGIRTVFKVDLSPGNVAETIAEGCGAGVQTLWSCHVIASEDFQNGETYLSLMRRNLDALTNA